MFRSMNHAVHLVFSTGERVDGYADCLIITFNVIIVLMHFSSDIQFEISLNIKSWHEIFMFKTQGCRLKEKFSWEADSELERALRSEGTLWVGRLGSEGGSLG